MFYTIAVVWWGLVHGCFRTTITCFWYRFAASVSCSLIVCNFASFGIIHTNDLLCHNLELLQKYIAPKPNYLKNSDLNLKSTVQHFTHQKFILITLFNRLFPSLYNKSELACQIVLMPFHFTFWMKRRKKNTCDLSHSHWMINQRDWFELVFGETNCFNVLFVLFFYFGRIRLKDFNYTKIQMNILYA